MTFYMNPLSWFELYDAWSHQVNLAPNSDMVSKFSNLPMAEESFDMGLEMQDVALIQPAWKNNHEGSRFWRKEITLVPMQYWCFSSCGHWHEDLIGYCLFLSFNLVCVWVEGCKCTFAEASLPLLLLSITFILWICIEPRAPHFQLKSKHTLNESHTVWWL